MDYDQIRGLREPRVSLLKAFGDCFNAHLPSDFEPLDPFEIYEAPPPRSQWADVIAQLYIGEAMTGNFNFGTMTVAVASEGRAPKAVDKERIDLIEARKGVAS